MSLRIAMLAPPWISIPPKGYGGLENVVHELTEGLVRRGHTVHLFATGDSKTDAHLHYYHRKAVGNDLHVKLSPYPMLNHLHHFYRFIQNHQVDIVHNHIQYEGMFFCDLLNTPFLHTLHVAYDVHFKSLLGPMKERRQILRRFAAHPYVSISDSQRKALPNLNYIATIYNGIDIDAIPFHAEGDGYLSWLGRVSPAKGIDIALKVAHKADCRLKFAAVIDTGDMAFFTNTVQPLLDDRREFIGAIETGREKSDLIGNSRALLFTPRWQEPFGLVLAEALAAGTPVIAYARGSVPEIIKDGETGFLVNPSMKEFSGSYLTRGTGVQGLLEAVARVYSMPAAQYRAMRARCRKYVETHFSTKQMIDRYENVYKSLARGASNHDLTARFPESRHDNP